jgi:hypothetical protein
MRFKITGGLASKKKSLAGAMVVDLGCSKFASAYTVLVD